jgi:asparagine synthase (glutamine-hydrolysing)
MCGIAGIIATDPGLVTAQRMKGMTDAIAHRGPDGEACWLSPGGNTVLGHRRLSIIDLSATGAQPMHYAGRYTIVYNGEIYNYLELKQSLQQKGYSFHSQSDTEVILAAYAAYGADCLGLFDGMFAFAIWDEQEQMLFAARDRFGEKPFYYYKDEQQLVFASEMKALWAAGIPREMNEEMLFNYITLGYVQDPGNTGATFYKTIHKLPARSFLVYNLHKDALTEQVYWEPAIQATGIAVSEDEAAEKLKALLSASVNRRLRSDVPVGTSLSGGLDSTSILAFICQANEQPAAFKTFSAVFPGFSRDESGRIQLISEAFGVANYQVQPDADSLLHDLEAICYHQEEPFQSASIAAQYKVFELAKQQGVTVLLDGQGADETMAGYPKYYEWYWRELYRGNKPLLHHELAQAKDVGGQWDWKNKLRAAYPAWADAWLVRQRSRLQRRHPDLAPEFTHQFGVSHYDIPAIPTLNGALYYNTFLNGLEELLQYADRNSMAYGREVRLPFLNHELVEFIFSLPAGYKIRQGYTKWLLRKSMNNLLPHEIVWRREKTGFEPPQQSWMQDKRVADCIQESKKVLVHKGVLNAGVLHKKNQPHDAHAADSFDWRYLVAGTLLR